MSLLSVLFRLLFPRWRWHICRTTQPRSGLLFTGRLCRTIPDARQHRAVRGYRRRQWAIYPAGNYRLGILRQLPLLFTIIELLGALYLLWIGSLLIRSRPQTLTGADARSTCPDLVNSCCWDWVRHCLTQKCTVLSGANDRPARPVGDAATTNHERDLDDQRGAVLGSADRDVHRFTADPAAVNQRILWVERIAGGVLIIFGCAIALRFCRAS